MQCQGSLSDRTQFAKLSHLHIPAKGLAVLDMSNASASQTATILALEKLAAQMEVSYLPFLGFRAIHLLILCTEYCSAGYYCTNAGCCPNGASLAECGATVSLSIIPPSSQTSSVATEFSNSITTTTSSTTGTTGFTVTTTESSSSTIGTTSSTSMLSSSTYSTTTAPNSTLSTTSSPTTSTLVQQTVSAGQKLDGSVIGLALSSLGLLLMLL